MVDAFSGMDCRLRKSMKDSIMMNSLFVAMNKAHEKLKSRQGVIGRLIEISKFYELAVMQLDGCLRIVEEEVDSLSLEGNHEEMLSDLYMIRDRLQRRLDDTELTIMNTDSCLAERLENELKLREALEMKEKQLVSLQGDLDQLERTKSEGHKDMQKIMSNQVKGVNDNKEGDISQLKNSVDMKFCSFKQIFEEKKFSVESSQIDQLSSDIDRLKESLDLAFGKMQNAIFLSEVVPAEHEWRWSIEKDVMHISAKGLMQDFRDVHEPTVWKLNYFSLLMNEIRSLRDELEQLTSEKESQADSRIKVPPGAKERPPLDAKKGKNDEGHMKAEQADQIEEEGGNYVAKLISTHEKIIQKKLEEQKAKEKLIREKWYSAMRKDKQPDGLNKKIQDVIARLDGIINLNLAPYETSRKYDEDRFKPMPLKRFSSESEIEIRNMASFVFCPLDEDLLEKVRMLEKEKEDSRLQFMILEETWAIVLRNLMKDCCEGLEKEKEELLERVRMMEQESEHSEAQSLMLEKACGKYNDEIEQLFIKVNVSEKASDDSKMQFEILEDVFVVLLRSLVKERQNELAKLSASKASLEEIVDKRTEDALSSNIQFQIYNMIIREITKDICQTNYWMSSEMKERLLRSLDFKVGNDIFAVFAQQMKEWSKCIEMITPGNLVREENERIGCFQKMFENWKMEYDAETKIREDIQHFVVVEAAKDAFILSRFSEKSTSNTKVKSSLEYEGEDSLIRSLDHLLKCLETEQQLNLSLSSKVMEQHSSLVQESFDSHQIDGQVSPEELINDDETVFSSVVYKFQNALHQLHNSQLLITELLRCDSGIDSNQTFPVSHGKDALSLVKAHNLQANKKLVIEFKSKVGADIDRAAMTLDVAAIRERDCSAELSGSSSESLDLFPFTEIFDEFEQTACKRLETSNSRLQATIHNLASLIEPTESIRRSEALYKNAFISRCHSLQVAETEVDLLGDQVDFLLTLLEKIYWTLHHHSPDLTQYFEVSNLLNLIKKEISCPSTKNS